MILHASWPAPLDSSSRSPALSIPAADRPADSAFTTSHDRLVTISTIEDLRKRD